MAGHNHARLESQLQREITYIIQRKMKDPRVQRVHIVRCELASDHGMIKVYWSTLLATDDRDSIQKGLDSARAFVRGEIIRAVRLRVVPRVEFFLDTSIEHGDKILALLSKIRDDRPAGSNDDAVAPANGDGDDESPTEGPDRERPPGTDK